jgi:Fic family protein
VDYRLDASQLNGEVEELDKRRWLFAILPIDPTHAEWLRRRAWVRTVHGTTRIEGNTLSDVEVDALLSNVGRGALNQREAREIIGTSEALKLADELSAAEADLDEGAIRELHRRVLWQQSPLLTPGEYRRGENRVTDAAGRAIFASPPSGDVPELMRAFTAWLSGSGDQPAVKAALAHLEVVAVHPFNDGNGRTARLLSRMILGRHGYGFDGLVSLDAQLDIDRTRYFRAIRRALGRTYEPGYDATPFVAYFVRSINRAADSVLARVRNLGKVMIEIRRAIAEGSLPPAMIDGLAYAWVNRHLRPADYIRLSGRSPQSTTRDMTRAVQGGWLLATGERRGRYYVLGPRLVAIPAEGEIAAPSP